MASKYIVMVLSAALGIHCSFAIKDWWNAYNLYASWTNTDKLMMTSLMGLATSSFVLCIFYVSSFGCSVRCLCWIRRGVAILVMLFGIVYFIASVLEMISDMYCNYYLCWMQILKYMILPVIITINLVLFQFKRSPSKCITVPKTVIKIHIYASIFVIIGGLELLHSILIYKNIEQSVYYVCSAILGLFMLSFSASIIVRIDSKNHNEMDKWDKCWLTLFSILVVLSAVPMPIFKAITRNSSDGEICHYVLLFATAIAQVLDILNYIRVCEFEWINDTSTTNPTNSGRGEGEQRQE